MRRMVSLWLVISSTAATIGCATGGALPVGGRQVQVTPRPDAGSKKIEGELIAVDEEKIWVLGREQVITIPLDTVRRVKLQRHSMTGSRVGLWTAVGAVVTGSALAIACSSVEGNSSCGRVFLAVGATWALGGAVAATSARSSSTMQLDDPRTRSLQPYARFPQGLPEGVDLSKLQEPR
jgi:hypothetical protein